MAAMYFSYFGDVKLTPLFHWSSEFYVMNNLNQSRHVIFNNDTKFNLNQLTLMMKYMFGLACKILHCAILEYY